MSQHKHQNDVSSTNLQDSEIETTTIVCVKTELCHLSSGECLSYAQIGPSDGLPLLVVGGLNHHLGFLTLFSPFNKTVKLITFDRPGSGSSTPSNEKESRIDQVARQATGLLHHLGIKKPIAILGQSCGAVFALAVAKMLCTSSPQSVSHVFLVSPWVMLGSSPHTNLALRTVRHFPLIVIQSGFSLFTSVRGLSLSRIDASTIATSVSTAEQKILLDNPLLGAHIIKVFRQSCEENRRGEKEDMLFALEKREELPTLGEQINSLSESIPITIFHGTEDGMVPIKSIQDQISHADRNVHPIWVSEGTHNLLFDGRVLSAILETVSSGLTKCVPMDI